MGRILEFLLSGLGRLQAMPHSGVTWHWSSWPSKYNFSWEIIWPENRHITLPCLWNFKEIYVFQESSIQMSKCDPYSKNAKPTCCWLLLKLVRLLPYETFQQQSHCLSNQYLRLDTWGWGVLLPPKIFKHTVSLKWVQILFLRRRYIENYNSIFPQNLMLLEANIVKWRVKELHSRYASNCILIFSHQTTTHFSQQILDTPGSSNIG